MNTWERIEQDLFAVQENYLLLLTINLEDSLNISLKFSLKILFSSGIDWLRTTANKISIKGRHQICIRKIACRILPIKRTRIQMIPISISLGHRNNFQFKINQISSLGRISPTVNAIIMMSAPLVILSSSTYKKGRPSCKIVKRIRVVWGSRFGFEIRFVFCYLQG